MSNKRKNLTSGMVVTEKKTDCRMTIDADNCMQYVVVCTEPNPTDPEKPIVTYTINGVEVPRPDVLLPCLEPGTTAPVYVMGGKLVANIDFTPVIEVLAEVLAELRKDTPFNKTRYCNQTTGTWWEKLCVVEKQEDGAYQTIVVSDEDTFESCVEKFEYRIVCVKRKDNDSPAVHAWASVHGTASETAALSLSLYSVSGQDKLNPDEYEIVKCC